MMWYIKVGDSINRSERIRLPFLKSIPEDYTPSEAIFKVVLFECEDE